MVLTQGRRKYIATLCERFATVAFAAAFASELFARLPAAPRTLVVGSVVLAVVLGFVATPSDGGK